MYAYLISNCFANIVVNHKRCQWRCRYRRFVSWWRPRLLRGPCVTAQTPSMATSHRGFLHENVTNENKRKASVVLLALSRQFSIRAPNSTAKRPRQIWLTLPKDNLLYLAVYRQPRLMPTSNIDARNKVSCKDNRRATLALDSCGGHLDWCPLHR